MEEEIERSKRETNNLKVALENKIHEYENTKSILDKILNENKLRKSLDDMASKEISKLITENADLKLRIKILNREIRQFKN